MFFTEHFHQAGLCVDNKGVLMLCVLMNKQIGALLASEHVWKIYI